MSNAFVNSKLEARQHTICGEFQAILNAALAGRLIPFVGAGVSVKSGLPDWTDLVKSLIARVPEAHSRAEIKKYENDPIMALELIQQAIPGDLLNDIRDEFRKFRQGDDGNRYLRIANDLHYLITRLPCSKIITTNYDEFLEKAAQNTDRDWEVRTRENSGLYRDIKTDTSRVIVKLHGSLSDSTTLIVTRSDYDKAYAGSFFNDWLEACFVYQSVLFIGFSFGDYDITSLIRKAKTNVASKVTIGPHYAIFGPDHGALANKYRAAALNLNVLTTRVDLTDKYLSLKAILVELQGEIARHMAMGPIDRNMAKAANYPADSQDSFVNRVISLCDYFWGVLGVDEIRVSFCDIADENDFKRITTIYRRNTQRKLSTPDPVSPVSTRHRVFLVLRDTDYFYIKKGVQAEGDVLLGEYNSGLIRTINEGGKQVGLLEVYSVVESAFTEGHLAALSVAAGQLADMFFAIRRKVAAIKVTQNLDYKQIMAMVQKSRFYSDYAKMNLKYILYNIDYEKAELHCQYDPKDEASIRKVLSDRSIVGPFKLRFKDESLATHVFNHGDTQTFVYDGSPSVLNGVPITLSDLGLKVFGIEKGTRMYATTIRAFGQMTQILVIWIPNDSGGRCRRTVFERIKRIVRLIKNDNSYEQGKLADSDTASLMGEFKRVIKPTDAYKKNRGDESFLKEQLRELLNLLVQPPLKFHKVRLWTLSDDRKIARLTYSHVTEQGRFYDGKRKREVVDDYVDLEFPTSDTYTQFTLSRFQRDVWARWQSHAMFDQIDTHSPRLDKNEKLPWITVPLVFNVGNSREIIGFVSADNQVPDKNNQPTLATPEPDKNFQRCGLDLIAQVMAFHVASLHFKELMRQAHGVG